LRNEKTILVEALDTYQKLGLTDGELGYSPKAGYR
jgi:hypothetical protein